jgi:hypothetical protein
MSARWPDPKMGGHSVWGALVRATDDPRHVIAFCDDLTIDPGDSTDVTDPVECWVAAVVKPEKYVLAKPMLRDLAQVAKVREFHLQQIANARKKTPWEGRSTEDRQRWVAILCSHAIRWVDRVYVLGLHLKDHQLLSQMEFSQPPPKWADLTKPKHATEFYFLNLLKLRLRRDYPDRIPVLVMDETNRWKSMSRDIFAPGSGAFMDSVFHWPSDVMRGLQLADLCAYAVNRTHRHRVRLEHGHPPGLFDPPLVGFIEELHAADRYIDLRQGIPGVRPAGAA